MKFSNGLLFILVLLLLTAPVTAYEAWQSPTGGDALYLAEYEDILDRFTAALDRAATAQAAHPQFLADLEDFRDEFAELLFSWLQADSSSGDYTSVARVPDLTGSWDLVANAHRSRLVIEQRGPLITGTLFSDEIKDGRIEADGSVHFIRSGSNQVYTGTISTTADGRLRLFGTFDCPVTGGRKLTWEAIRL